MYPWSSSSSSQQSIPTTASTTTNSNDNTNYNNHLSSSNTTNYNHHLSSTNTSYYNNHLTRYGSAPSSVFQTAIDSVFGNRSDNNNFYTGGSCGSADSSGVASSSNTTTTINRNNITINVNDHHYQSNSISNLQRSSGLSDMMNNVGGGSGGAGGFRNMTAAANSGNGMSGTVGMDDGSGGNSSSNLTRHSSSPAGFLHQLTSDIGFSITKGTEGYSNSSRGGSHKLSRLSSQLSFSDNPAADSLNSHIPEVDGINSSHHEDHMGHKISSTAGFSINAWQDGSNSFVITTPSKNNKRAKNNSINDDILNDLSAIDSQFCLPHTTLEMGNMDTMMHIPHDSVPCKIRAKRGFATHPRSIAERERRTRISGKLKKLQELVPNMDKQTSYADMLDLAVEHIKGLQSQVQKLNEEVECCTCGCKENL